MTLAKNFLLKINESGKPSWLTALEGKLVSLDHTKNIPDDLARYKGKLGEVASTQRSKDDKRWEATVRFSGGTAEVSASLLQKEPEYKRNSEFNDMVTQLKNGKLSPEDFVKKSGELKDSKKLLSKFSSHTKSSAKSGFNRHDPTHQAAMLIK